MEEYLMWWNLPFKFLFESWKVTSTTTLLFTVLGVFSLAVLFEGLRVVVTTLHRVFHSLPLVAVPTNRDDSLETESSTTTSLHITDSINYVYNQRIKNHCLQTILHMGRVIISYGLMLVLMSYNAYIFIAIIIGAMLGYFVFCFKIDTPIPCSRLPSKDQTVISGMTSTEPLLQSSLDGEEKMNILV